MGDHTSKRCEEAESEDLSFIKGNTKGYAEYDWIARSD